MNRLKFIGVTLSAMLITVSSFAQQREFEDYLPKAGTYSIGISANPIVNFAGNMFNGTIGQGIGAIGGSVLSPSVNNRPYFPTVSIMGKYLITDDIAVRMNVGFIINRVNDANYSIDDDARVIDPLSQAKVLNKMNQTGNGGSISAGVEYRVGSRKVQGIFSGSFMYAFSSTSQSFSYGNAITAENQTPSINDIGSIETEDGVSRPNWGNDYISTLPGVAAARPLEYSAEGFHSAGLVGGAGIEWFIANQISLGAEVNLALIYTSNPKVYAIYEGYSSFSESVVNHTELISPSTSQFTFVTQNIGGNLSVNFYF